MERKQVDSSTVNSIGYDESLKVLEVEFKKGLYQYVDVPKEVYDNLIASESIGRFVQQNIVHKYSYHRIV
jgi:hypothetical protein